MTKILKWLGAVFVGFLIFKGLTTEIKVEATTAGQLTKERSSITGRMEFRHTAATQNTFEDYIILKVNGEIVFCLDPTMYVAAGQYVGEEFKDVEKIADRITITRELLDRLTFITYFGYQLDPTHKNYHYTQALIWETLGYRAVSFSGGLSMAEYQAWKAATLAEVNGYRKVASFSNQTHTLKVGESITLTDTNNVLQNLTIPATQNGYDFTRNGNQLTITATKDAVDGKVSFTQPRDNRVNGTPIVFRKPGSQTVASLKLRDPQSANINLKAVKQAKIVINKISGVSGEKLADVEFTLYDTNTNKVVQTVKTNKNGVAEFTNLEAGRKFYIKETRALKGYMLNETRYDYTAVAGETKTFNVKNEPIPTIVSDATSASGKKQAFFHEAQKETVTMTNLVPNQQYRLVSYAMLPKWNTKWKEQTITFTPKTSTHSQTFTYTGVSQNFAGDIVYGAKLYLGNTLLNEHFDYKNKAQTVTVVKPTIVTVATTENGQKSGYRDEKHLEKATMTNVIPNRTYTLIARQGGLT